MSVVYLVHKARGGKPKEISKKVYDKNPMIFGQDDWRQATMEEIKKYNHVEPVAEKKAPPKATPKKKEK